MSNMFWTDWSFWKNNGVWNHDYFWNRRCLWNTYALPATTCNFMSQRGTILFKYLDRLQNCTWPLFNLYFISVRVTSAKKYERILQRIVIFRSLKLKFTANIYSIILHPTSTASIYHKDKQQCVRKVLYKAKCAWL